MRSLLIEFQRFKNLEKGILRAGDEYLLTVGTYPVRTCQMPLDYDDFLDLIQALRYRGGADERRDALDQIGQTVTALLAMDCLQDLQTGEFPLQLDLVVNAAELAALPFEALFDQAGQPLLVREERPIELTRRVRSERPETVVRWPARPRVLFAWACPDGVGDVPYAEHESALRAALKPWLPLQGTGAGDDEVLVILKETRLASLKQLCQDSAASDRSFTHVHLLAHGYPLGTGVKQRFGIAFHDPGGDLAAVTPEELTDALSPLCGGAVVVTLATCDSASMANSIVSKKSIAHELHVLGIPVVIASQLPLTVPGSNLLVERFYGAMLAGRDVRTALHEARLALHAASATTGHDWASLVGYVRLPETYAEHLCQVRLQGSLAALKVAQKRADDIINAGVRDPAEFAQVADHLQGCLEALESFLRDPGSQVLDGVLEENFGLLGSGEKRLAELQFERGQLIAGDGWEPEMRSALTRSRDWYRQGFEHCSSNHWVGVQYLSLQAALEGRIDNPGHWYAALTAAEFDGRKKPEDPWPGGSRAELYLLAPLAGQRWQEAAAAAALDELKARAQAKNDLFPIESTGRQLRRYTRWWTSEKGFFPGTSDLVAAAEGLIQRLLALS